MNEDLVPPDPEMRVAVVASLSLQEAALLAGRLDAEGIRAVVSPGGSAPGPWTALTSSIGAGLVANPLQEGAADVLVDERDLKAARKIAAQYLEE